MLQLYLKAVQKILKGPVPLSSLDEQCVTWLQRNPLLFSMDEDQNVNLRKLTTNEVHWAIACLVATSRPCSLIHLGMIVAKLPAVHTGKLKKYFQSHSSIYQMMEGPQDDIIVSLKDGHPFGAYLEKLYPLRRAPPEHPAKASPVSATEARNESATNASAATPGQLGTPAKPAMPSGPQIVVVKTVEQAKSTVTKLTSPNPVSSIAVDCEGIHLGDPNGRLCLVQLTAPGHPVYLFSLVECHDVIYSLKEILEDSRITKVLHDSRSDAAALMSFEPSIAMSPIEDTQRLFDWFNDIRLRITGKSFANAAAGPTKQTGLNALLKTYDLPPNPHKQLMKDHHDVWDKPISQSDAITLEYAAYDVLYLLELRDKLQLDISNTVKEISHLISFKYSRSRITTLASEGLGGPEDDSDVQQDLGLFELVPKRPTMYGIDAEGPTFLLTFDGQSTHPVRIKASESAADPQPSSSSSSSADSQGGNMVVGDSIKFLRKDVQTILSLFPTEYAQALANELLDHPFEDLAEIFFDLGRAVTIVFRNERKVRLTNVPLPRSMEPFLMRLFAFKVEEQETGEPAALESEEEVQDIIHEHPKWLQLLDEFFSSDNRIGIQGSLHRISAKRNRSGKIEGLTYRVGRHAPGCSSVIADVINKLATPADDVTAERQSLLLMGKPGVGKTTLLRELASRLASEELNQLVMIVDSSNEIGGDSDIPHEAIGHARRMQVPERAKQYMQMMEAVQNHSPNVIVVDEIGSPQEVTAAVTIAQRGVSMIATAHGGSLASAMRNTVLRPLMGGIETVILSATEAAKEPNRGKLRTVRKEPPTFSVLIEIVKANYFRIYHCLEVAIDHVLAEQPVLVEERWLSREEPVLGEQQRKIYGRFCWISPGKPKNLGLEADPMAEFGAALDTELKQH